MSVPRVSAVIVNHRTAHHVGPCLEALASAASGLALEVVLVDSASPDRALARQEAARSPLACIPVDLDVNRGFGAAANAGAARASAPLVVFVNPDTRPGPGALAALVDALDARPDAAAVAPRLVDWRGRPQVGDAGPLPTALGALGYALGREGSLFAPRALGPAPVSVGWLSGAFLLVRAGAFRAAGGWDESFFLYGEDVDLGRRLAARGGPSFLVPAVRVVHEGGASHRRPGRASPLEGLWAAGLRRAHARGEPGAGRRAAFALAFGTGLAARAAAHALGATTAAGLAGREARVRARALARAAGVLARDALLAREALSARLP